MEDKMIPNLYEHQQRAIETLYSLGFSGALIHEPGTGKTRTVLECVKMLPRETKVLVICPISIIEAAWGEDIKKWTPEFSYKNFHAKKRKTFDWKKKINIINYESAWRERNVSEIIHAAKEHSMMCVCDESSKFKSPTSKVAKTLINLAPLFRYRLILSGTPTPNSELEWWSQINFVEPGRLMTNFHKFKNTFFHLARGGQVTEMRGVYLSKQELAKRFKSGWEYKITPERREELMKLISPVCSVARKEECLDLPDTVDQTRYIEMSLEQARIYKEVKTRLVAEINGEFVVARNVLTKLMKLREITSGFVFDEAGGIQDFGSKKFNELSDLLNDIDGQVIIWGNYKYELEKIREVCSRRGTCRVLNSTTKDRDEVIRSFIKGETRYLVAHPLSAAHGLTFVNCSVQIFFSLSYSSEQYMQARARTHRSGQTKTCTYIHLLCKDTIDQTIIDIVRGKISAQEAVINIIKGGT